MLARAAVRLFLEAGRGMIPPNAHAACHWEAIGKRNPSRCLNGISRVGSKAELGQLQQLQWSSSTQQCCRPLLPACASQAGIPDTNLAACLYSTGSAAAAKAPMFFKKAIDDATSEWAQHHAKRYIDTKAKARRGDGRVGD